MRILHELLELRAMRRRLAEIVQREKPEVIHAQSPVLHMLPATSVAKRFGAPVLYDVKALWENAAVDHATTRERFQ